MDWDDAKEWYTHCVGEKGHYYHRSLILPSTLRLLALKTGESLLDLGCGQGVLERVLPEGVEYVGVDLSQKLLQEAERLKKGKKSLFFLSDVTQNFPFPKRDFDAASFLLSLQNIEDPQKALYHAAQSLKKGGRLLIVLNHPCFRIPRQSSWGIDAQAKLQYRRVQSYMSPQKIPIATHPGKKDPTATFSYHYPLSSYAQFLNDAGFWISHLEEWCSDKKSEGAHAKREDRARREIPLFLALLAVRKS